MLTSTPTRFRETNPFLTRAMAHAAEQYPCRGEFDRRPAGTIGETKERKNTGGIPAAGAIKLSGSRFASVEAFVVIKCFRLLSREKLSDWDSLWLSLRFRPIRSASFLRSEDIIGLSYVAVFVELAKEAVEHGTQLLSARQGNIILVLDAEHETKQLFHRDYQ